jgi:hypothetical protein
MRYHTFLLLLLCNLWINDRTYAQGDWPRAIIGSDGGLLYIYQPQPDSFTGNILRFKAAFSYVGKGKDSPAYGSFYALTGVDIDKDSRMVSVLLANVLMLGMSGLQDSARIDYLKETIECGMPGAAIDIPLDELVSFLPLPANEEDPRFDARYRNEPPRIIVASKPSILVLIDGPPKFRRHPAMGVNMMINTPNTIMESEDGWFYLYGSQHWYIGPAATGPYNYTGYIAPDISRVRQTFAELARNKWGHTDTIREGAGVVEDIIVSAPPAELILTRGKPVFERIAGTSLQYVTNSNNDIFLDSLQHLYYVLLSGRWFSAAGLNGPWTYVPADALPGDFGRIPEGSPKDNVLASVAGTDAAREAIADALLPQTSVISRIDAAAVVSFDGPAKFEAIPGTKLQYAVNSSAAVLRDNSRFYCVEKGVWFTAERAGGPWKICTERPAQIALIPPECPVYFCKYVEIYGSTPDYVYTGYTSGYLNAYINGPTLVYGSGWKYPSWTGNACFARPWTWGFNMAYNPWFGWCLGGNLDPEWLNTAVDNNTWTSGWWGASDYQPPYIWHHFAGHGLYEQELSRVENISYVNNVYRFRQDRVTRPAAAALYTDTIGDVYMRKDQLGWWLQKEGRWTKVENAGEIGRLNAIESRHKRGEMRIRNFLRLKG